MYTEQPCFNREREDDKDVGVSFTPNIYMSF